MQHIIRHLKKGGRCGIVLDEGLLFRTSEDAFVKTKRKLLDDCQVWCILSLPGGVFTAAGAGVKTNLLFFTKGEPTETIWYYDLSHIKVGKRTPLTLDYFQDFFERLLARSDSENSWTVNITERKQQAAQESHPLKQQAKAKEQEARQQKEQLKILKKAKPRDHAAIKAAEQIIKTLAKEARQFTNKATEIDDAVYDLKAVNPHKKAETDDRTPEELISIIEAKGVEIAAALNTLRQIKQLKHNS